MDKPHLSRKSAVLLIDLWFAGVRMSNALFNLKQSDKLNDRERASCRGAQIEWGRKVKAATPLIRAASAALRPSTQPHAQSQARKRRGK